jgi:hypothetical protein
MGADDSPSGWLLLLVQLPTTPSRVRVALWRRLRAIGATMMVNGAWLLPDTAAHAEVFTQLEATVTRQHGTGFVLSIPEFPPEVSETVVQRFRADRAREYDEFAEQCLAFLDEVAKETRAQKYTFAEMEESEQDLGKLTRWLAKIGARDFFPDERKEQAATQIARCRNALTGFSRAVYLAEGVQGVAGTEADGPGSPTQPVWTANGRPGSDGANPSSRTSLR